MTTPTLHSQKGPGSVPGHRLDIAVSTPQLRSAAGGLRFIATDVDGFRWAAGDAVRVVGHARLGHAVASFAGNWSRHRAELVARARSLAEACAGAAATYERVDAELAVGVAACTGDRP